MRFQKKQENYKIQNLKSTIALNLTKDKIKKQQQIIKTATQTQIRTGLILMKL